MDYNNQNQNMNQQPNMNQQFNMNQQPNMNQQFNNNQNQNMNQQINMNQQQEDDKKANLLCIISIVCAVGKYVVLFLFALFAEVLNGAGAYGVLDLMNSIAGGTFALISIAALVLMIVARVKYPKNVFAKVLMWVYIAIIIVYVVGFIISVFACSMAFATCVSSCRGIPG